MLCLACSKASPGALCPGCLATMRPAPERLLPSGIVVRAAFSHEGAARRLVHRLKYRHCVGIAELLAAAMAPAAADVDVLVPVPRATVRRWHSGTDPAHDLAIALGRHLGIPVMTALSAPLWWPRHAGRGRVQRRPVAFAGRFRAAGGVALVDDVVTTGTTLESAAAALAARPLRAVVATAAGRVRLG